jgi:hypothetical protein
MPFYENVHESAQQWLAGQQPVLRSGRETYQAYRYTPADLTEDSLRQETFENLLCFLSERSSDGRVPVYTRWNHREFRLDLKCVRHALRRGFINLPQDDAVLGYVSHLALRG